MPLDSAAPPCFPARAMYAPRTPERLQPPGALGVAAAILYVFLWAAAFVPSRVLAHSAPPLSILWIRFLAAGALLFAVVGIAKLPVPRDGGTWLRLLLLGVGANAVY